MTVGFPGTGIGGLFYILVALLAPVRTFFLKRRFSREERSATTRLFVLSVGVVAGIFTTGWLLGFLLGPAASAAASAGGKSISQPGIENVVRMAALSASLLMLALVLLAVQVARLTVRKK